MLKAVFFDIDDTLYSTSLFAAQARKNSVSAMIQTGLKMPHNLLLKELEEVIVEFTSNYERHFDTLLLRIPKKYYEGVNPAVIVAAGVIAYHNAKFNGIKPFPDVIPALKRLSKINIIKGVISSGLEIKQAEKILRLGIYDFFVPSAIFFSDQIGISKPNPKLYLRACEEIGVNPNEAIYVGDNHVLDIDPANSIGMTTILIKRPYNKHTAEKGQTKPSYIIHNLGQLLQILRKKYKIIA
jgi:putative hydrolase of the HAD superfamily